MVTTKIDVFKTLKLPNHQVNVRMIELEEFKTHLRIRFDIKITENLTIPVIEYFDVNMYSGSTEFINVYFDVDYRGRVNTSLYKSEYSNLNEITKDIQTEMTGYLIKVMRTYVTSIENPQSFKYMQYLEIE